MVCCNLTCNFASLDLETKQKIEILKLKMLIFSALILIQKVFYIVHDFQTQLQYTINER